MTDSHHNNGQGACAGGSDDAVLRLTSDNALARIRFDLQWQCGYASHCDTYVAPRLDLRRDLLPPAIAAQIMERPMGCRTSHRFGAGELFSPTQAGACREIPAQCFGRGFAGHAAPRPRVGRFYPRGILSGVDGIFEADRRPLRIVDVGTEQLQLDLSHPLADKPLVLSATVEALRPADEGRGGPCIEVQPLLSENGPGMQARRNRTPTDFWSDLPFSRADPRPDGLFYDQPRFVDHLDRIAIEQIRNLYGRLLPARARVLDLMTAWHSHLPLTSSVQSVTGLGMNREELDANPVLSDRVVHDLNCDSRLPCADAAFDAVICTVSVEYLTEPFGVFRELARVLAPGGVLIVTFSNRWFPPKVIRIWRELHEFERIGLVLEYFMESGLFDALNTWTLRGLPRPVDDAYAARLALSDPIFAVWGNRIDDAGTTRASG
ncbi:MAG: class I SAM-dependent methyltransferase [Thiohalocapsa sp.]|nr:class I SAM-dependent methyltransferase [Thiohalocapsa sp.]MCF7989643.1 class I SAM-dependent methyltransferase [Thiohalocapsa sp.]